MTPALPVAGAAERLRKPPGRPRKATLEQQAASAVSADAPRLLGVRAVATYLGIGVRKVHELRAAGHLRPVTLPLAGGADLRRLLFDKMDLDAFIDGNKAGRAVK